jgi:hypothetical protein
VPSFDALCHQSGTLALPCGIVRASISLRWPVFARPLAAFATLSDQRERRNVTDLEDLPSGAPMNQLSTVETVRRLVLRYRAPPPPRSEPMPPRSRCPGRGPDDGRAIRAHRLALASRIATMVSPATTAGRMANAMTKPQTRLPVTLALPGAPRRWPGWSCSAAEAEAACRPAGATGACPAPAARCAGGPSSPRCGRARACARCRAWR